MDLSKKDKKAARIIIDKGLEKEFGNALSGAEAIVQDWRNSAFSNRDAYHALYKHVEAADNQIARRYDGLSGSRYLLTVMTQYSDGLVTNEDLELLSEEVRAVIHSLLKN